jgi:hypothetical protein
MRVKLKLINMGFRVSIYQQSLFINVGLKCL